MGLYGYIESAMSMARYKLLEKGRFYGSIPGFRGVWADAASLDACRRELHEVLEDWIVLKLRDGDSLPKAGGRRLKVPSAVRG